MLFDNEQTPKGQYQKSTNGNKKEFDNSFQQSIPAFITIPFENSSRVGDNDGFKPPNNSPCESDTDVSQGDSMTAVEGGPGPQAESESAIMEMPFLASKAQPSLSRSPEPQKHRSQTGGGDEEVEEGLEIQGHPQHAPPPVAGHRPLKQQQMRLAELGRRGDKQPSSISEGVSWYINDLIQLLEEKPPPGAEEGALRISDSGYESDNESENGHQLQQLQQQRKPGGMMAAVSCLPLPLKQAHFLFKACSWKISLALLYSTLATQTFFFSVVIAVAGIHLVQCLNRPLVVVDPSSGTTPSPQSHLTFNESAEAAAEIFLETILSAGILGLTSVCLLTDLADFVWVLRRTSHDVVRPLLFSHKGEEEEEEEDDDDAASGIAAADAKDAATAGGVASSPLLVLSTIAEGAEVAAEGGRERSATQEAKEGSRHDDEALVAQAREKSSYANAVDADERNGNGDDTDNEEDGDINSDDSDNEEGGVSDDDTDEELLQMEPSDSFPMSPLDLRTVNTKRDFMMQIWSEVKSMAIFLAQDLIIQPGLLCAEAVLDFCRRHRDVLGLLCALLLLGLTREISPGGITPPSSSSWDASPSPPAGAPDSMYHHGGGAAPQWWYWPSHEEQLPPVLPLRRGRGRMSTSSSSSRDVPEAEAAASTVLKALLTLCLVSLRAVCHLCAKIAGWLPYLSTLPPNSVWLICPPTPVSPSLASVAGSSAPEEVLLHSTTWEYLRHIEPTVFGQWVIILAYDPIFYLAACVFLSTFTAALMRRLVFVCIKEVP